MSHARSGLGASSVPGYVSQSLAIAILAAVLAVILSGSLFIINGIFLAIRDVTVVLMALTLAPVAWALHQRFRPAAGATSAVLLIVGLAGIAVVTLGSLDSILANLGSGAVAPWMPVTVQSIGLGLVGLWFLATGALGWRHTTFENRITTASLLAGCGFAAFAATAVTLGPHPVLYIATVVGLAGFLSWAVWLRRGISTDRITEPVSQLD